MRIHAQPIAANGPAHPLRQLLALSTPRLHRWTDDPASADIIFVTSGSDDSGAIDGVRAFQPLDQQKCIELNSGWEPPYFLGASLGLGTSDTINPFIEAHDPATTVARRPDLLASFLGHGQRHPLLTQLFALPKNRRLRIEDGVHLDPQRRTYQVSLRSKFILCPRGVSSHPTHLFEALKLGIAPVIISDDWIPSPGPRWEDFAVFIAERDIVHLPAILAGVESTHWLRGEMAHEAYGAFFSPATYFNHLVASALSTRGARDGPERHRSSNWTALRFLREARFDRTSPVRPS